VIYRQPPTVPVGPPPCCPTRIGPEPPPGFSLSVRGRLKAGQTLQVSEVAGRDEGYAPQPATLCYQHGTSRKRCASGALYQPWTVVVLPGRQQYLTLQVGGKTVARVVYRNVNVGVAAVPSQAPAIVYVPQIWQLNGPQSVRVGQTAFFASVNVEESVLCYKHGSSRVRCQRSPVGGFYVDVLSGHDQYFTLRVGGKVVAKLVYRNVA
jgi:hypothetical protein